MRTLPQPTTDLDRAKSDLDVHGYCLVAGALTSDDVSVIKQRLVEQAAGEDAAGVGFHDQGGFNQRVWMLLNKGDVFASLVTHPLARELMTHVLGPAYLLSSITANI